MRRHVYLTTQPCIFVAEAESLHEYTAYRHTLSGKGPANFAGHSTRRPDTERMNVRCTPGICARPSLCSFGKCLPPHHCRPIYVLLSDSYTSLACDAKAVWPSTVLYPLWSLSTFGTFTTRVGDFFRQNCRLGVLFLGRLVN